MWRRTTRDRVGLALMAVATLALLTLDFRTHVIGGLSGAVGQIIGVFQAGVRTVVRPVEGLASGVQDVTHLRDDNRRLERENQVLRRQAATYEDLARENARLRQLMELTRSLELRTISSRVIGASLSGLERSALLDKGTSSGIVTDSAVIGPEGLVGRVSWAGSRTAKAQLITDSQSSVGVKIGETGETGVVSGTGGSVLLLELVSRAALDEGAVKKGDVVLTSGYQGGIFPAGVPIGRVEQVALASRGTSYQIIVRPFARLSRLDVVSVVVRPEAEAETEASPAPPAPGSVP